MAGIPEVLIAPLQAALQSQGFPGGTVRADGTLNPAGLLAGVYTEVEFRSSLTPNIRIATNQLAAGGPPNPLLSWLRPTVILRGASGELAIAPAGASNGGSILPGLLIVGALVGIGVVIGKNL